jgi:hypothetical protein
MSDSIEILNYHNRSSSDEIDINIETSLIASTNHILDLAKANNGIDRFIYNPPF